MQQSPPPDPSIRRKHLSGFRGKFPRGVFIVVRVLMCAATLRLQLLLGGGGGGLLPQLPGCWPSGANPLWETPQLLTPQWTCLMLSAIHILVC